VSIFMLVAAGLIPAFILKSCDNGTTSNRNEPDPNQPLIDALAWARGKKIPQEGGKMQIIILRYYLLIRIRMIWFGILIHLWELWKLP